MHLPAAGAERRKPAGALAPVYVEEALGWLPDANRRKSEPVRVFAAESVQAPDTISATGRILLAEDNADMRGYVRRLLGQYYEVETVANGSEALAAARRDPPHLILTDVMMPGLDGFGLLRELRADESTKTIPVILLSARAGEDARVEGLGTGADDYIVKPFTARELLARVSAHLALSRLRREVAERERALRAESEAARERATTLLESISDGFLALDPEWRFTYVNAESERVLGMSRSEMLGKSYWDLFPAVRGTFLETQYRRAMTERIFIHYDNYYVPWQRWFENRIYPAKDGGLSIFYQDITQRKQTEEAMRRANEALEAANADLEQYAYSATHDLREPLRMVRIYCELLSQTYTGKIGPDADRMLGYCAEGARRMDDLISDLLTYMRAASPTDDITEAVPVETSLDAALLNLRTAIVEADAIITRDPIPSLRVAPVHAQQIFQNLIGNSLKYRSVAPPVIHIGARREGGVWIFSVRDNGIGIDPIYKTQVFGLFKRLHTAAKYSGTGIGLAICKRLVERYGGRIWLESEAGAGSTFFFSVPE